MTLSDLSKRVSKLLIDNSPTILTTIGVVGTLTTAYFAGRASFQAADIIRDVESREGVNDDPRERIKERTRLVWKLYIPAMTTCAATITCIIGANRIGTRRAAAVAAALSITDKALEEYRAKVVEKIGEKKEEVIRAEINQDRVNKNWDDSVVVHGLNQGEICYDKFSDRYVWNTREGLRAAVNDLNQIVLSEGYATVGDLYHILDMPAPSWSHEVGWNSNNRMLELRFSAVTTPAGQPVIAFEFDNEPIRDYKNFR